MPLIQLATFSASEEFASSPDIFKEPVNLIKGAEGYKGYYISVSLPDKRLTVFSLPALSTVCKLKIRRLGTLFPVSLKNAAVS
jgi:hypothetical protein